MHDAADGHQDRLTEPDLRAAAERARASTRRRSRATTRRSTRPAVSADYAAGIELGVRGTPTIFVDGDAVPREGHAGAAARGGGAAIALRTALVTGAGRGIGRGIALGLARAGYAVASSAGRARTWTPWPRRSAGDVCVAAADLIDATAVLDAVARVEEELGGIGLLVNNAGVIERARCRSSRTTSRTPGG